MKLLLYCTKAKPKLYNTDKGFVLTDFKLGEYFNNKVLLNGKIVAECDFEVEEINVLDCTFRTTNLVEKEILDKSCLTYHELFNYLKNRENPRGYAIHIKNLHIFDKPKELKNYSRRLLGRIPDGDFQVLGNAPQNMMKCCELKYIIEDYILISITPKEACNILNHKQDELVRRNVLKEMK